VTLSEQWAAEQTHGGGERRSPGAWSGAPGQGCWFGWAGQPGAPEGAQPPAQHLPLQRFYIPVPQDLAPSFGPSVGQRPAALRGPGAVPAAGGFGAGDSALGPRSCGDGEPGDGRGSEAGSACPPARPACPPARPARPPARLPAARRGARRLGSALPGDDGAALLSLAALVAFFCSC